MGIISINGTDIETLGFYAKDLESWWGGVSEQTESFPVPGSYYARRAETSRTPPKSWPLALVLQKDLQSARETALDALRRLLAGTSADVDDYRLNQTGEVKIVLSDSTRMAYAVYQGDKTGLVGGRHWTSGAADVVLDLVFYDAAKYEATNSQVAAIGNSPTQIVLGTLPSWWTLSITGAATTPAFIVYSDSGGTNELWRITTASVAGGSTLVLNSMRQIATLSSVDVTSTYLVPGSGYFRLLDGTADGSVYVKLTSGTGVLDYRKRWR